MEVRQLKQAEAIKSDILTVASIYETMLSSTWRDICALRITLHRLSSNYLLILYVILIAIMGISSTVKAYEKLNLSDITVRQSLVERLSHRRINGMAEAYIWAFERNIPVLYDDGENISELMYLRKGRPIYYTTYNANSASSICTDKARLTYGLNGTKQTIGIWDGSTVRSDHIEFGGRVILFDDTPWDYHATGVAGTIGAAGEDSLAMGMAPESYIDSYDWINDIAEVTSRAASFPDEPNKIYVSNHSYGIKAGWSRNNNTYYWWGEWNGKDSFEELFGQYDEEASQVDGIAYNAPYYLMFKAAGNDRADNPSLYQTVYYRDRISYPWESIIFTKETCPLGDGKVNEGYGTISGCGNAKNIMTVGAIENVIRTKTQNVNANMTSFSSWGPTDDGRIKPDIVADGSYLYTTNSTSAFGYQVKSGTSFSCPLASGSALLLTEYYLRLFPEVNTGKLCPGVAMRASTLKGLIIHTADDLGSPGPDYCYGWGLMNTKAAVDLINKHYEESTGSMFAEMTLSEKDPEGTYYIYNNGYEPIRITLSWTDPPAEDNNSHDDRTPCLQNDLDIRVISPNDEIFYPYVLNPDRPTMKATTGDNYLDNIEQIVIHSSLIGTYVVMVSYKGTLRNQEQDYSLISTQAIYMDSDL